MNFGKEAGFAHPLSRDHIRLVSCPSRTKIFHVKNFGRNSSLESGSHPSTLRLSTTEIQQQKVIFEVEDVCEKAARRLPLERVGVLRRRGGFLAGLGRGRRLAARSQATAVCRCSSQRRETLSCYVWRFGFARGVVRSRHS